MSATQQPTETEETYECSQCGSDRRPATSVAGSFCSIACHQAHRREKRAAEVFELLEHDHRFCGTCGRQLKEVDKPADTTVVIGPSAHQEWDHAADVFVGYQHRTQHAEVGEISMDVDDEADRPIVQDGVATGTICKCGNTSHRHTEPAIRDRCPFTTAHYLARAARVLRSEDKHDVHFAHGVLVDGVLEQTLPVEDEDAVGLRAAFAQAVVLDD